jgi:AcrR family transcriptional regulator
VAIPQRRTQEERSTETRRRLLDATVSCLLEYGYQGTTTSAVQQRAGVSRGALMHHYSSKAELLVASVRHLARQRAANLREQAMRLPEGSDRIGQAIDLLWEMFTGPLFTANLELWSAARTDEELRAAIVESERGLRADLHAVMVDLFGPKVAAEPSFADAIELTLQFMRGAALTAIVRSDARKQNRVVAQWKPLFAAMIESGGLTDAS